MTATVDLMYAAPYINTLIGLLATNPNSVWYRVLPILTYIEFILKLETSSNFYIILSKHETQ